MTKTFVEKHSKIRAYDSSSCFAGKLPSLTLMNAENILPNSLSDGFAVAKRQAIMAHDGGFPNLTKKQIATMDLGLISSSGFGCFSFLMFGKMQLTKLQQKNN